MDIMILVYVLLILAVAKFLGEVVSRFNLPAIVGELMAGVLLGPFLLGEVVPGLSPMYDTGTSAGMFISDLADFGMLFLMLYAGLEFTVGTLKANARVSWSVAATSVSVTVAFGLVVGSLFDYAGRPLIFMALVMGVTALPVTIRVLKDLEVMKTMTGNTIVGAALVADGAMLLALGIVLSSGDGSPSPLQVAFLSIEFLSFFAIAFLVGRYVVPVVYSLLKRMRTGEAAFAIAMGFAIGFAILAVWVGLPAVIGAFVAGLLLRETGSGLKVWARVQDILSGVTIGFLAPIFFAQMGFLVQFDKVVTALPLLGALVFVVMVSKIGGSYVPARTWHLGKNESLAIGSMMMAQGAMDLVFAKLGLNEGLIEQELFSVLVVMIFVSTLIAPVLFRFFFNKAVVAGEIPPSAKAVEAHRSVSE
jgi:Kef-type K+ transport system membrane component KefB